MTRRALPLLLVLAASALGLAACGGGSSTSTTPAATGGSTGGGGGQTVDVTADPSGALKFEQTQLTASPGPVTIHFTNMSSLPHDVILDGPGVSNQGTSIVTGGTADASLTLESGDYTFYCSVDGHRAAGMEGTLVVK